MDCPTCKTVHLALYDRQGIEIDYCPQCRGVWLDRGELDKIIERSSGSAYGAPGERPERDALSYSSRRDTSYEYPESHHRGYHGKRKREGFLSDLFDFD
jgi:hypothetical protein